MDKPFDDIFKLDEPQTFSETRIPSSTIQSNNFEEINLEEPPGTSAVVTQAENVTPQFAIVKTHMNENSQGVQVCN